MSRRPLPGQLVLLLEDDDVSPPVPVAPPAPEPPPPAPLLLANAVALPWLCIHSADPDPRPPAWWREDPAAILTGWVGFAAEVPAVAAQLRRAISLLPIALGAERTAPLGGYQVTLRRDLISLFPEKVRERGRPVEEFILWRNPNYGRH